MERIFLEELDKLAKEIKRYDESNYANCFRLYKKDNNGLYEMINDGENYERFISKVLNYSLENYDVDLYRFFNICRHYAHEKLSDNPNFSAILREYRCNDSDLDDIVSGIYNFIVLAIVFVIYENRIKFSEDRELSVEQLVKLSGIKSLWFRGQSNYAWYMTPSMIRDLPNDVVIDSNYFKHIYDKFKLHNKYNTLIGADAADSYQFLTFMQHACEYSPLIDVSSDANVATIFALTNKNKFNAYSTIESKLFVISGDESPVMEFDEAIRKCKSYIYTKQRFPIGRPITFEKYDPSGKKATTTITITKINDLIKRLTPEFVIVNAPTNDRMKYQKGGFIYFYDYLSINGRVFYDLNPYLQYRELLIRCASKDLIRDYILKKHPYYEYEHLMNPYKHFNE